MLLALVAFVLQGSALAQGPSADAIEQEWRIRDRALESRPISVSAADSWTAQLEALEALSRRLELGREELVDESVLSSLRSCLDQSAPNVRAAALVCLGLSGYADWSSANLVQLARDPLPEVQIELCRAVPPQRWATELSLLRELAVSPDLEVRRAARIAVYRIESSSDGASDDEGVARVQSELLANVIRDEGVKAYLDELETWSRVPRVNAAPFPSSGAEQHLRDSDPSGRALRAARALWRCLSAQPMSSEAVDEVAAGWCDPLSPEWERPHRIQQSMLLSGARRLRTPLAEALLVTLRDALAEKDSVRSADLIEWIFEGLLEAEKANWVLAKLGPIQLRDDEVRAFLSLADSREFDWEDPILASWLSSERSVATRFQVADEAAVAFAAEVEVPLLLPLLEDPQAEVRRIAFQALCNASPAQLTNVESALFRAWSAKSEDERLNALTQLPRSKPLPAFRESLLALGSEPLRRRLHPAIVELLGLFAGDDACSKALSGWLAEDVTFLVSQNPHSTREFRTAEVAARGEARALNAIAGEAAVGDLRLALGQTQKASLEVAKTVAWCLGRSSVGRAQIGAFLGDETPSRVRVEVALSLAAREDEADSKRAFDVLLERFEHCDGELRGRILAVLAKLGTVAARDFALTLITDPNTPVEQCAQAIEVLVKRLRREPSGVNFAVLVDCLKQAPTPESRRLVIDALGRAGDVRATPDLEALLHSSVPELEGQREATLIALGSCAPASDILWRELWRLPVATAESRLALRFQGASVSAVAFSFRGEIEALRAVVRAKAWPDENEPPLARLDGRLCLALAQACREGGDEPHTLQLERAAHVALAGEFPDEKSRFAAHRTRARLWAAAERAGRDYETAHFAARMIEEQIAGRFSVRDQEAILGVFDPERGIDPAARVRASWFQARAKLAAESGDREWAYVLLESAFESMGFSRAARLAQDAAEQELL